ncbi:MAG: Rrf2 family transcriptional regulator [Bacteroidales bacterium]|nr:Rrf2 family transcriptional regulator [Bacteroidales bacterium]
MNFSKTTSYSLNVLSYMAKYEDRKMSASLLHDKLQIPYSYLRYILLTLSKNGFIHGTTGRNGGFLFSKDISEISLADIIEATEGLDSFNRCVMGFSECPFSNKCAMHKLWEKTRIRILKVLMKTSLADLMKKRQ